MANKTSDLTTALVGCQTRSPLASAMKSLIMSEIARLRAGGTTDEQLAVKLVDTSDLGGIVTAIALVEAIHDLEPVLRDLLVIQRLAHRVPS